MGVIAFAILAMIAVSIGWRRGFFSLPSDESWIFPIKLIHVIVVFAIYFAFSSFVSPLIAKTIQLLLFANPTATSILSYATWVNFINSSLVFLSLAAFAFLLPIRKNIWCRQSPHSYGHDFSLAAFAWFVAFPLVVFVNQSVDWILTNLFHIQQMPEQLAVQFLKMTFGHPLLLILAIVSITVLAPLVEEILFRGFLQSFIRQHLGSKQAIVITSALFSLFHYSSEQGMANLTIVVSLFIFSLFLGLIYEKRGALTAPVALHSLFNTVNVVNLYFLGGIPGGSLTSVITKFPSILGIILGE